MSSRLRICEHCKRKYQPKPRYKSNLCSLECRFWNKVDTSRRHGPKGDCWGWKGIKGKRGYGEISISKTGRVYAHRVSYEIHIGPIPERLFVCHTCDNPSCTNPKHQFLGTNGDNMADKVRKNRQRRGESSPGSKLTESQVTEIKKLWIGGEHTQREIGRMYGIGQQHVSHIVRGRLWKHVS